MRVRRLRLATVSGDTKQLSPHLRMQLEHTLVRLVRHRGVKVNWTIPMEIYSITAGHFDADSYLPPKHRCICRLTRKKKLQTRRECLFLVNPDNYVQHKSINHCSTTLTNTTRDIKERAGNCLAKSGSWKICITTSPKLSTIIPVTASNQLMILDIHLISWFFQVPLYLVMDWSQMTW